MESLWQCKPDSCYNMSLIRTKFNNFYMICLIAAIESKLSILGHILYMRSSDPEEFWPALFEKAYAKYVV